eukprot:1132615-Alexandrium_andersonii.AAC.1
MREGLQRGHYERAVSPWGSWAFPTRPGRRKRRVVVDYRQVNQRTVRAVYALRRSDDIKSESTGRVFYTLLDAVSGFNQ